MITQQQIDDSRDAMQAAASAGYDQFRAAQSAHKALVAAERAERMTAAGINPSGIAYVVGDTYRHRKTLLSLGLTWDSGHNAWTGTNALLFGIDLPAGCRLVSQSTAALASMDHAASDY